MRLMLAILLAVAPVASAGGLCVGDACVEHETERSGGVGLRCNGPYQQSTYHASAWVGDAWVTFTQRCQNAGGWGNGYDYAGVGWGGDAVEVLWWQDGYDETWRCGMDVDGAAMPCMLGPPLTLP